MKQHRRRNLQLRRSTRTLPCAGIIFLAVLLGFVLANTLPMVG